MSKVKVDLIRPRLNSQIDVLGGLSANNEVVASSVVAHTLSARDFIYGNGVNMSETGKVLQYVHAFGTADSSTTGIYGIEACHVSITPRSSTSSIIVNTRVSWDMPAVTDHQCATGRVNRSIGGGTESTV